MSLTKVPAVLGVVVSRLASAAHFLLSRSFSNPLIWWIKSSRARQCFMTISIGENELRIFVFVFVVVVVVVVVELKRAELVMDASQGKRNF